MAVSVRSLLIGLFAGVFLALLLQHNTSSLQLPFTPTPREDVVSTPADLSFGNMAHLLRNSLQMAGQAVRAAGGYKSASLAATSLRRTTTPAFTTTTNSPRSFSTPSAAMAPKTFIEAVEARRTIYALNKEAPISDKEITEIAKKVVLHVPSSFNSQSTRIVVLLGKEHDTFWDYVLEVLKPIVPAEQLPSTEGRISGFKAGYGTALFLEDPEPVEALRKAFPIYAHHFGDWSEHTSAMHQYALWTALEAEGLGANLQHYNPLIDRKAQEHWNIPVDWKLRAQLVFGGKVADAGEKEFKPVEGTRLFVHGAKE